MTAAQSDQIGQVRPVPRLFLQTFWTLHRAMFRVTGGRIGLQRPERGAKFGMLRVHTVGRRSAKERITMLGYFEEGANLVTLAMNGWGKAEPAWWLNLQANPAATVDLSNGKREVRARAATAAERDRLWATLQDYPGWGSDIDALAAHRPGETAIVVFEPTADIGTANAATTLQSGGTQLVARPSGKGRRLRRRHLRILPGLAIAIVANELGKTNGVGIAALIAFGIAPDLPRLLGVARRPVSSPPVQAFNVLHNPVTPIAAVGLAAVTTVLTGLLPMVWLVAALVWLSHVVIGRGLGDVPRHRPRSDP